ncbi:hypothetical protein JCM11491_006030 [Sporobolomyces phaffii]
MAQRIRPLNQQTATDQAITAQTSLVQVKTLVQAGIGCIAFLRGLFDEDSFEDAKLEAPRPPLDSTAPAARTGGKDKLNKPSTVRIKKLKKGGCESADKLIDWLELGVNDGIEKGYLHRLIFAIYLDPDDPTNLVESYTFTFTYETDGQGNRRADMVIHDQMKGMVLSASKPAPGEGEVKRQVQQVVKNLLTSTQLLDELPRRRFLTLRALWYDETPDDYQPHGFQRPTRFWPDYNLTTNSVHDAPDTSSLGTVQTGYHSVSVHTVTISHVLETSFDDTITKQEATERNQREASTRQVVWDAQTLVESVTDTDDAMKVPRPLGVVSDDGHFFDIETVSARRDLVELGKKVGLGAVDTEENGVRTKGLAALDEPLVDSNLSDNENLRRAIAATSRSAPAGGESVTQEDPVVNRQHSYKPPIPAFTETAAEAARADSFSLSGTGGTTAGRVATDDVRMEAHGQRWTAEEKGKGVERTDARSASHPQGGATQSQLLEFTQRLAPESHDTIMNDSTKQDDADDVEEPDTIQTDSSLASQSGVPRESLQTTSRGPGSTGMRALTRKAPEDEVCECGDPGEGGGMVCCTSCELGRHNACYGYTDDSDTIPDIFHCYRCRGHAAKADLRFDETREGEIEHAMADLTSLALFRRAIALIWDDGPVDSNSLAQSLSLDRTTASQVLKRLKVEGFIVEKSNRKNSRARGVKNVVKRTELVVNKSSKQVKYKDSQYFSPGAGAEGPILTMLVGTSGEEREAGDKVEFEESERATATARSAPCSRSFSTIRPGVLTFARVQGTEDARFRVTKDELATTSARVLVPATRSPAPATAVVVSIPHASSPSLTPTANNPTEAPRASPITTVDTGAGLARTDEAEEARARLADGSARAFVDKDEESFATRHEPQPSARLLHRSSPASSTSSIDPTRKTTTDDAYARLAQEDRMEVDASVNDDDDDGSLTPRRTRTSPSAHGFDPTTPGTPLQAHFPASMPNPPAKRRASPEPGGGRERGASTARRNGLGLSQDAGGASWKRIKKQKASDSGERLEAE